MFKVDKKMTANGSVRLDVSASPFECLTLQFGGDLAGGSLQIFSVMGGRRATVADGGPFNDVNALDQNDFPIRRIVIPGRADSLDVVMSGATNPDIIVSVR